MALIFPRSLDRYVRIGGAVAAVAVVGGVALAGYLSQPKVIETGYQPQQPVPYSHKLHAGNLGLDCFYCHNTVYKAAYAAVPATETCMNCHVKVKPQSPQLLRVRESYSSDEPIPWVKVHRLPDYVYFNHQAHVTAAANPPAMPNPFRLKSETL